MIIDLFRYGPEVSAMLKAVEHLVDPASRARLRSVLSDLENGRDNRLPVFPWNTSVAIKSGVSNSYDRPGATSPDAYITWSFDAEFALVDAKTKKWGINRMVTHVKAFSTSDSTNEAMHFHFDLKNAGQLGPHIHMQVSENFAAKAGPLKLGVPRFPSATVLPTDCLDLVLTEFFQERWTSEQAGMVGLSTVRQGQLDRARKLAAAIEKRWSDARSLTPFSALQNYHFPELQLA